MKNVSVFPWHPASKGAASLAEALGSKRISRKESSKFVGGSTHSVINWGASVIEHPGVLRSKIINAPSAVRAVSNKLDFFQTISKATDAPRIPEWTQDANTALSWFKEGREVVARHILNGHSGVGIHFFSDHKDNLPHVLAAKLFVKYVKKKEEFRVHIIGDKVVHIQQKKLRKEDDHGTPIDPKMIDFRVRNLQNGFIFAMEDIELPVGVADECIKAVKAIGLDFGAVDVIWNESQGKSYILEINTAPGLMGTTPKRYAEGLVQFIQKGN